MALKLLHFANARLGATLTSLGSHGREHRAASLATLANLGDLAVMESVQAVLISGDLFDCAAPSSTTLKTVQTFFLKLHDAGIAAIVLPGTRDPEGVFDAHRQPDGADLCPGALVLGPQHTIVRLKTLNLVVCATTVPASTGAESETPLPMPLVERGEIGIGLTYRSTSNPLDMPNMARALARSGIRYVGIGGDAQFACETISGIVLCSPGVPEPLDWGHEQGSIALVQVENDGSLKVDKRTTGSHTFARRELQVTAENARKISSLIARQAHPDLALEIVLTGECPFHVLIDPSGIEADLSSFFFHLRIIDRTKLVLKTEALNTMPQGSIVGNFARVMESRIRDSGDDEHAGTDREAYQIGMSLLQGGGVQA